MARRDVCGNDYRRAMEIRYQNSVGTYDSFECAIQKIAPVCEHCRCRVIGHGVEHGDRIFCCAHCAEKSGVSPREINAWSRRGWG